MAEAADRAAKVEHGATDLFIGVAVVGERVHLPLVQLAAVKANSLSRICVDL